jgi:hypothetical protein
MADISDGGMSSRKLHLAWLTMFLATVGFLLVGVWPALAPIYPEYLTGLLASAAVYSGANILTKKVLSQTPDAPSSSPPDEQT